MKKSTALTLLGCLLLLFGLSLTPACTYNVGEFEPPDIPIDTNLVSFSEDVIPIFNADCNSSGCHNAGGIPPDLTPPNAYRALWDGGFIDTMVPEQSELIQWMLGNRGLVMPPSGTNPDYNATVLSWIAQGAQDN